MHSACPQQHGMHSAAAIRHATAYLLWPTQTTGFACCSMRARALADSCPPVSSEHSLAATWRGLSWMESRLPPRKLYLMRRQSACTQHCHVARALVDGVTLAAEKVVPLLHAAVIGTLFDRE